MYKNLIWKDHAVIPDNTYKLENNSDGTVTLVPQGKVIQQGTNMCAANFNNMEMGLTDHDLAAHIMLHLMRDMHYREHVIEDELAVERKTIKLTNSKKYPFNNSAQSVSLTKKRKNKDYILESEIVSADGTVGEIEVSGKTLNGFKLAFTGSAKNITVDIIVRGGII